jgi:hypothetical protein
MPRLYVFERLKRWLRAALASDKYVRVPDEAKMPTMCWRTVPGHPKYEAHPMGFVRRIGSEWPLKEKHKTRHRLVFVRLFDHPGVALETTLASLICLTFNGPQPLKHVALHLDRNPENNRASNLKWWPRGSWNKRRKVFGEVGDELHIRWKKKPGKTGKAMLVSWGKL